MSNLSSKGTAWEKVRAQALKRDGYICQLQFGGCVGEADTVDHVLAKANGGTDTLDNLVAACRPCNSKKQDKMLVRTTWLNPRWF
ncbi:HNH endonuclease [Streptomyces sp. NBC_01571]|uniref:HNH endonuclease n=1 Tax=Streptomyces sp. NBC_01571 TaxID=2975883 RepID=UPI00338F176C